MGIKDLLRFLKPYIEPVHIKKYAGTRVGIDAYSWLHKGAYSCSMELCLNSSGEKKLQYLKYFMHRINLLRHYDITPVVVFDGGSMPCKAATEQERHRRREANRDLAMAKLKQGDVRAASELFQRAVSISPAMAYQLIQVLNSENVEFVVAPYEADAQLAYLCSLEPEKGGIVAVITEDSDLLAYCCQAVIFKMDRYGNGEEIVLDKLFNSVDSKPSFCNLDRELFTGMCVLAGCDFLPSVPGIGIAKSYSLVSKYRNLDRVLSVLKSGKGSQMPEDYIKSFKEALAVFQHARIYDAHSKKLELMRPLSQKLLESLDGDLDFLGPDIPPSISTAIAEGNLDPVNMKAFDRSLQPVCNLSPVHISGKRKEPKDTTTSTKDSCFMVFPSCKTNENEHAGAEKQHSDARKYVKQDVALDMLLLPSESHNYMAENALTSDKTPLKFPDNNPFKKRKVDEVQLDIEPSPSDQISIDSRGKNTDPSRMTTLRSRPVVSTSNPFRKRIVGNNIYSDEDTNVSEQVSISKVESLVSLCVSSHSPSKVPEERKVDEKVMDEITLNVTAEVDSQEFFVTSQRSLATEQMSYVSNKDNSNVLDAPLSTQESVSSKPKKVIVGKGTRTGGGSSRKNSKNLEGKDGSIFKYFSRVK